MGWPHCRLKPAQLPCMIGVDEGQAGAGSPTKPTTAGNMEMHGSGRSGKSGSRSGARELRRGLADFVLALALFWGVVFAVGGSDNRAHAISLPTIAKETIVDAGAPGLAGLQAAAESRHALHSTAKADSSRGQALLLLSLAFAAIVACNLAFWRHLRRVYASPRRSVWRRV
jgi:hypothetical protein